MADYLFRNNLLVNKLATQVSLPEAPLLQAGTYVCFAGDTAADYSQYLAGGNSRLRWDGSQLTYSGAPVQRITYYVVEVGYQKRFFANPMDSLSYGAAKPWAALYLVARAEVANINSTDDAKKARGNIQSQLSSARTLLNADPDFIVDEKDAIATAVHDSIQSALVSRLKVLGIPVVPSDSGYQVLWNPEGTPPVSPLLRMPDLQELKAQGDLLHLFAQQTRPMAPTTGGPIM